MVRTISVLFGTGKADLPVGPARDDVGSKESSSGTPSGSAHEGRVGGRDVVVAGEIQGRVLRWKRAGVRRVIQRSRQSYFVLPIPLWLKNVKKLSQPWTRME